MQYYFYIENVLMPVAPTYFNVYYPGKNKTYDLAAGGEIVIPALPGLRVYRFGALLPSVRYPFAQYAGAFRPPEYYIEHLKRLRAAAAPFDLMVVRSLTADTALRFAAGTLDYGADAVEQLTGSASGRISASDARILLREGVRGAEASLFDTTVRVTLESLSITEDAEKYGRDFFVDLEMKQYREYKALKLTPGG